MFDGHGSAMSKMARETRNRKKNRNSIFNNDKNELPRGYQEEFQFKKKSTRQQEQLARKVNQLAKYEQIRTMMVLGIGFVFFVIGLLIYVI